MKKIVFALCCLALIGIQHITAQNLEGQLKNKYGFACKMKNNGVTYYVVADGLYKGRHFGLCDAEGKLLIPVKYDEIPSARYDKGYLYAKNNKKMTIFDIKGNVLLQSDYEDVKWYQFEDKNVCEVEKGGKIGLINKKGELLIPCEYDDLSTYKTDETGLCEAKKNGKVGVFSITEKKLLVPCEFDDITYYHIQENGGLCEVENNKKKGVYSTTSQRLVVPCEFDDLDMYDLKENGCIGIKKGSLKGAYSKEGKMVVPCEYSELEMGKKAIIVAKGGERPADADNYNYLTPNKAQWAAYDLNGKMVLPLGNDYIYNDDDAPEILIINKGFSVTFEKEEAAPNGKYKYKQTWHKGQKYGMYNVETGASVPLEYEGFSDFGEGMASFLKGGKYGYLDTETGKVLILAKYKSVNPFKKGVAQVKLATGATALIKNPKKAGNVKIAGAQSLPPVDENIPETGKKNDEAFAFIFAVENYKNFKGSSFAINDGKILAQYCEKTLGMPKNNIMFYEDATFGNIVGAIQKIRDIVDVFDGTAKILVYFSGIGSTDAASKESYLLPSDAALNTLKTTGYSVNKLTEELGKMNSKQTVVIIDAPMCGTNRLGQALVANRGVSIVPKSGTPQGNVVLSMASSTGIPAYAVRKYGHGLFTYGILSKLQETKGNCTIKDVTDAASLWVKKTTLGLYKKTQAPIIIPSQNLAGSWATLKF